ncbi:hypothetical protein HFP15_09935 [Amycolatopsis sp. K13G38]|uniref:N-acetyltransferase domain-containing protein n=1 Tax=Amycolatopsis acididurans TaxID=2724524 RepID=A0ABX1J1C4_9PSEU|nr:hypothetical protein [Amycolatopsis acididurans]NKQ53201.1 hypothetical protein [Amycolatopsis acididurans]
MISYEWRSGLEGQEAAEVAGLVNEAAEYDEEAGFSRVTSPAARPGHHLLVRVQPGGEDDPWPLAAYARLAVSGGAGTLQLVVRPEFRSLGIATLVFEKLGLPPAGDDGWCGTGATVLLAWAHGDHPAAERMARRFGAAAVRRMWKLVAKIDAVSRNGHCGDVTVRPLEPADLMALERLEQIEDTGWASPSGREHLIADSSVLVATDAGGALLGAIRLSGVRGNGSPSRSAGTVLTLSAGGPAVARVLLESGLDYLRKMGFRRAQIYVDAGNAETVRITRALGFVHDRSDVCYVVSGSV